MKCPFCDEEIKDEAKKCRFCGEWLTEIVNTPKAVAGNKDYSNLKMYNFCITKKDESGKEEYKYESILAANPQDVREKAAKLFKGYQFHEGYGIQEEQARTGKFTCPNCKSKFTICKRDIGCAMMIIIFVSLGLGLIMIPFLPNHCTCRLCGYKWKS